MFNKKIHVVRYVLSVILSTLSLGAAAPAVAAGDIYAKQLLSGSSGVPFVFSKGPSSELLKFLALYGAGKISKAAFENIKPYFEQAVELSEEAVEELVYRTKLEIEWIENSFSSPRLSLEDPADSKTSSASFLGRLAQYFSSDTPELRLNVPQNLHDSTREKLDKKARKIADENADKRVDTSEVERRQVAIQHSELTTSGPIDIDCVSGVYNTVGTPAITKYAGGDGEKGTSSGDNDSEKNSNDKGTKEMVEEQCETSDSSGSVAVESDYTRVESRRRQEVEYVLDVVARFGRLSEKHKENVKARSAGNIYKLAKSIELLEKEGVPFNGDIIAQLLNYDGPDGAAGCLVELFKADMLSDRNIAAIFSVRYILKEDVTLLRRLRECEGKITVTHFGEFLEAIQQSSCSRIINLPGYQIGSRTIRESLLALLKEANMADLSLRIPDLRADVMESYIALKMLREEFPGLFERELVGRIVCLSNNVDFVECLRVLNNTNEIPLNVDTINAIVEHGDDNDDYYHISKLCAMRDSGILTLKNFNYCVSENGGFSNYLAGILVMLCNTGILDEKKMEEVEHLTGQGLKHHVFFILEELNARGRLNENIFNRVVQCPNIRALDLILLEIGYHHFEAVIDHPNLNALLEAISYIKDKASEWDLGARRMLYDRFADRIINDPNPLKFSKIVTTLYRNKLLTDDNLELANNCEELENRLCILHVLEKVGRLDQCFFEGAMINVGVFSILTNQENQITGDVTFAELGNYYLNGCSQTVSILLENPDAVLDMLKRGVPIVEIFLGGVKDLEPYTSAIHNLCTRQKSFHFSM